MSPPEFVDSGMPADRSARLAARRAFVSLKMSFLHVIADIPGLEALNARIRLAESPEALWDLRAPVYAALAGTGQSLKGRRQLLHRSLESLFPIIDRTRQVQG